MKTTENKIYETPMEYPCLKASRLSGIIVMFTGFETGTVVIGDHAHPLGEHVNDWSECLFDRYTGKVILEND